MRLSVDHYSLTFKRDVFFEMPTWIVKYHSRVPSWFLLVVKISQLGKLATEGEWIKRSTLVHIKTAVKSYQPLHVYSLLFEIIIKWHLKILQVVEFIVIR